MKSSVMEIFKEVSKKFGDDDTFLDKREKLAEIFSLDKKFVESLLGKKEVNENQMSDYGVGCINDDNNEFEALDRMDTEFNGEQQSVEMSLVVYEKNQESRTEGDNVVELEAEPEKEKEFEEQVENVVQQDVFEPETEHEIEQQVEYETERQVVEPQVDKESMNRVERQVVDTEEERQVVDTERQVVGTEEEQVGDDEVQKQVNSEVTKSDQTSIMNPILPKDFVFNITPARDELVEMEIFYAMLMFSLYKGTRM